MSKNIYINVKEFILITIGLLIICFFTLDNISRLNSITVLDDEFGYWGIANSFIGNNWRELLGTIPYYGYGAAFFYSVLLSITNTSVAAYKLAIVLNCIFLVISFLISIYIFINKYKNIKSEIIIITAIFVSLYPNTIVQSQIAWVESMLYCWFWVLFLLCFKLDQTKNHKIFFVSLFSIWSVIGLMIHLRTAGITVSAFLYIIYLRYKKDISYKNLIISASIFVITFAIFLYLKQNVSNNIYNSSTILNSFSSTIVTNNNELSGQVDKILSVFSIEGFVSLLTSIFGKLYYLTISTCFLVFVYLYKVLFNLYQEFRKYTGSLDSMSLFLLLSFLSTLLISAIFMIALESRGDTFLYGRYVELLIGPILMYSLVSIYEKTPTYKSFLLLCLVVIPSTKLIVKIFEYANFSVFHVTNITGISSYFLDSSRYLISPYDILSKYLFIAGITLLFLHSNYKRTFGYVISLSMITAFLWFPNINAANSITYQMQDNIDQALSDTADYLNTKADDIQYIINDSTYKDAFVDLSNRNLKYLQFLLGDKTIIPTTIDNIEYNKMILVINDSRDFDKLDRDDSYTLEHKGEYFSIFIGNES